LIDIDHIVHLENVEKELEDVTRHYGLKHAPVSELSSSGHNTSRARLDGVFVGDTPHTRTEADIYPDYRDFYDDELVRKISSIYSEDFSRYGYSAIP
jgi:hypothetical protein